MVTRRSIYRYQHTHRFVYLLPAERTQKQYTIPSINHPEHTCGRVTHHFCRYSAFEEGSIISHSLGVGYTQRLPFRGDTTGRGQVEPPCYPSQAVNIDRDGSLRTMWWAWLSRCAPPPKNTQPRSNHEKNIR